MHDGITRFLQMLGSPSTTAQVHPYLLTTALVAAAGSKGTKVVKGIVSGLQTSTEGNSITGCVHISAEEE